MSVGVVNFYIIHQFDETDIFLSLKLRNNRFNFVVGDAVWKEVSLPQRSH